MASRTESTVSRPGFVVDLNSLIRNGGRQIDWSHVADARKSATTGKKVIEAGTVMGERASGKLVPRADSFSITGITRAAQVATATAAAHGLAVGDVLIISGADQSEYNGEHVVASVPTADTFTFAVSGSPATPATGTIVAAFKAKYILTTRAVEDEETAALTGYGVLMGGALFANLLPDATGTPKVLPAAYLTELKDHSTQWVFEQYEDTRQ